MKCPSCGAGDQTGRFCAECGAALGGECPSCSAAVEPGARFCPSCGEPLTGKRPGSSKTPWVIAGVAVAVVALVLFLPDDTRRAGPAEMTGTSAPPFAGGAPGGSGAAGAPGAGMGGLSSDMRVNADRLFNRIMTAAEQGNQAEVDQFMPMAIQAYGMVEDLDDDGLYHLAVLHLVAGDPAQARATTDRILDASPDHILALGVAAEAAAAAGDSAAAAADYRRLLEGYGAESAKPLPEYVDHQPMLEEYRERARAFTGGA